jgi:hypothetical protein
MFHRYDYEAAYYPSLSRLPLDVRRKLDLAGIKISLKDWLAYSLSERTVLCHFPCDSDEERQVFSAFLDFLTEKYSGKVTEKTAPQNDAAWSALAVPAAVAAKSAALGCAVTTAEWQAWPPHDRYGLYKTAESSSQPEAFEKVLHQLRKQTTRS